jgi:SAM-dependent methyltransferase
MTELSVRKRAVEGDLFTARVLMHAQDKALRKIAILEAGCGRGPGLSLPADLDRHVTGIDVDTPPLRAHTLDRTDLNSWHLGDLRNAPLPPRAYDVVHADSLIERLTNAELVLDRMVAALKPGGLLLIRMTDRDSAHGLLTRALPRWFRALLGEQVHSTPPPIFEPVTSLTGIRTWCLMRGLVIAEAHAIRPPRNTPAAALARLIATFTAGRYTAAHREIVLVVRKPENRFARII